MIAGIKELGAAKVGDTLTLAARPAPAALPGFKEIKPQVFAGLYPVDSNHYDALRDALQKLKLNDASLRYEPETSQEATAHTARPERRNYRGGYRERRFALDRRSCFSYARRRSREVVAPR